MSQRLFHCRIGDLRCAFAGSSVVEVLRAPHRLSDDAAPPGVEFLVAFRESKIPVILPHAVLGTKPKSSSLDVLVLDVGGDLVGIGTEESFGLIELGEVISKSNHDILQSNLPAVYGMFKRADTLVLLIDPEALVAQFSSQPL